MRLSRRKFRQIGFGRFGPSERQHLSFCLVVIFLGVFGLIVLAEVLFVDGNGLIAPVALSNNRRFHGFVDEQQQQQQQQQQDDEEWETPKPFSVFSKSGRSESRSTEEKTATTTSTREKRSVRKESEIASNRSRSSDPQHFNQHESLRGGCDQTKKATSRPTRTSHLHSRRVEFSQW